jgi:Flp pilus assembly protein TadG
MTRRSSIRRSGATAVEAAVILPVLLIFTIGVVIGGLGIFRYQEVALLAREGSRWASVHGATYQSEAGAASPVTATDVYNNGMKPLVVALDTSKLTYTVTYSPDMTSPNSSVTVTVNYQWLPEAYLIGPIKLSCTSTRLMAY